MGKFVIDKSKNDGFKFVLKAGNGEVIAVSQIYSAEDSCLNGIESVRKNAAVAAVENQTAEGYAEEKILNLEFTKTKRESSDSVSKRLTVRLSQPARATPGLQAA